MTMSLLSFVIKEGVKSATKNAQIKATGAAVATAAGAVAGGVIAARAQKKQMQANAVDNGEIQIDNTNCAVNNKVFSVNPSREERYYYNDNVIDVAQELLGCGFLKIILRPKKKLNERKIKDYGLVSSISINGKKRFCEEDIMPASAFVVIEYLEFEDNINQSVYERVNRVIPGVWSFNNEGELVVSSETKPTQRTRQVCPYCNAHITSEKSNFCSSCGGDLTAR